MEIWQAAALGGIGVASGWLNVMAGGGSMLTVPAMLLFGMPAPVANGTNRIAILAQNLTAVLAFRRRGYERPLLGLSLGAAALPGALAGALTGVRLRGETFEYVLAGVMVLSLLLMWRQGDGARAGSDGSRAAPPSRARLVAGHLCMLGVGFWGGLIQVGVGFVLMPVLNRVLRFDLVRVNQYKVLIVLVYTLPTLVVFASQAGVMWGPGVGLAIGNALGGWLGAHSSMREGGARLIQLVFNVTLLVLIAQLLLF